VAEERRGREVGWLSRSSPRGALLGLDHPPDPLDLLLCRSDRFWVADINVDIVLVVDPEPGIDETIHLDAVSSRERGTGLIVLPPLPPGLFGAP